MHASIYYNSLPPDAAPARRVALAKQHGFAGVELVLGAGPGADLGLDADEEELVALRWIVEKAQVRIDAVSFGGPVASLDYLPKLLQAASALGAPVAAVTPPHLDEDLPYDRAMERVLDALTERLCEAEQAGITLAVEAPASGGLLASPLEARDFVDHLESDAVGICLHVAHAEDAAAWARILGGRVRHVWAADSASSATGHIQVVLPFQGRTNWFALREALAAGGYDGPLVAEYLPYASAPELTVEHLAASLRAVLTGEGRSHL